MSPLIEHDHSDHELQAYTGNRYADPWSKLDIVFHILLALLGPPALTIIVFLRPKLGYRIPKPWILFSTFAQLAFIAGCVNAGIFGFDYVRDNTPLGAYLKAATTGRSTATTGRSAATIVIPPDPDDEDPHNGYDAPFPPGIQNWTLAQKQAWTRQHYMTDDKRRAIARRRYERNQKAEAAASAAPAAPAKPPTFWDTIRNTHFTPHWSLIVFALAFVFMGLHRRYEGRQLIKQQWHTMSRGQSYVARLFPHLTEYAVQTYVEPGLVALLAILYAPISISLSLWLLFAASAVTASEILVMEISINRVLDQFDREVEARQMQKARELLREHAKQQRVADTKGVRAVVFAADIEEALGLNDKDKDKNKAA